MLHISFFSFILSILDGVAQVGAGYQGGSVGISVILHELCDYCY